MDKIYRTTTGNEYPIKILYELVDSVDIPVNKSITESACKEGCSLYGRNGGCPPFAPSFDGLTKRYKKSLIILTQMNTEHYPEKVLHGKYYVKWVFVETTITRLLDRLGRQLSEQVPSIFLGSGHCIGCSNKKCSFKNGDKCANPKKRTFSLEATGVLVTDLVEKLFNFPLYWWNRNEPNYIPPYMCKIVGCFTIGVSEQDRLRRLLDHKIDLL